MQEYKLSHQDRLQLNKGDSLMTYRAVDSNGRDFFCLVVCEADGFKQIHEGYLNKISASASSYGEVIYCAYSKDPDEQAEEFLRDWLIKHK